MRMQIPRSILVIASLILLTAHAGFSAEEILPLPGMGTAKPVASGEELIQLPGQQQAPGVSNPTQATPIEIPGTQLDPGTTVEMAPSPEIVIDPLAPDGPAPTTPPVQPANQSAAPAAPETNYPLMPKDTSSAIFMVMKTWECQDYDLKTLIEHAASVYGQEAEDRFEVKGLAELTPVTTSVKEEDVTFDELLDVVTRKHGLDWGVDVAQKTIYIYPGKKP